ncbi:MAG TPA: response regulator transcription factor [Ktedonobacteraceae bacterium]
MIRILLAEDQTMMRGALRTLLSLEDDMTVVAEAERGDQVVEVALSTRPDVALLDIEMPGMNGIDAAAALRRALPSCSCMILTTFGRPGYLRRAMESGVTGFLLKDAPVEELAAAIRRVIAGQRLVDPGLAAAALSEGKSPLTVREREVLAASRSGASVAEIAKHLCLTEGTVRNYLSLAIQKLGVHNRTEAAQLAEGKGWL